MKPAINGTYIEVNNLRAKLQGVRPNDNLEYTPVWRWEGSGMFSVRSTYHHFSDRGICSKNPKAIWSTKCPKKIECYFG